MLPIAHMVWGGDGALMWDWGVLDFAGGTVVHINAGIAGFVACLVLGKRKGYPHHRHAAAQPQLHHHGRVDAVGGLVRFQRRQRGGCQWRCRHGDGGDPDCDRHGRAGAGCSRNG